MQINKNVKIIKEWNYGELKRRWESPINKTLTVTKKRVILKEQSKRYSYLHEIPISKIHGVQTGRYRGRIRVFLILFLIFFVLLTTSIFSDRAYFLSPFFRLEDFVENDKFILYLIMIAGNITFLSLYLLKYVWKFELILLTEESDVQHLGGYVFYFGGFLNIIHTIGSFINLFRSQSKSKKKVKVTINLEDMEEIISTLGMLVFSNEEIKNEIR